MSFCLQTCVICPEVAVKKTLSNDICVFVLILNGSLVVYVVCFVLFL